MGIAGRFTLGLGLAAVLFAVPATFGLLKGTESVTADAVENARRDMAGYTADLVAKGGTVRPGLEVNRTSIGKNYSLQTATAEVETSSGPIAARIYRVPSTEDPGITLTEMFAPPKDDPKVQEKLFFLVLMVTGGLVLITVIVGSIIARRTAAPLQAMIEDVMAVSRGRADHSIRARSAAGEVAHLARAVDRMVRDLVEKQETQAALEKRQREAEVLRELRRNLQPMAMEPPTGFVVETTLLEASGAGTGDFVDSLSDGEGRPILVVGATAARGTPGALLMAMTRAYLRSACLEGHNPAEACDITNTSLNRDLARGLFASAMVARLNPAESQVELVSAGHKAPAVRWDAASGQLRKLQPNGIALGFDQGPVFRKSLEYLTLELKPKDGLFMFSPETFECTNAKGVKLGEKGVYSLAKIAMEKGLPAMEKQLRAFLGDAPDSDLGFALMRRSEGA